MAKRYVRGDRAFGRLLKQLPESVTTGIRGQLNATGRMLLSLARRKVAARTGALSSALSYAVPPKRLSLKVGLIGKALNKKYFYGHVVEWGRKAQVVTVTRRGTLERARGAGLNVRGNRYKNAALSAGIAGSYQLHVKPLPPRHFVFVATRAQLYPPFRSIWTDALRKAAAGASDD